MQQATQLEEELSDSFSNVEPEQVPELSGAPEQQLEEQVDLNISLDSESRGRSVLSSEFNFGDDVFDVDRTVSPSHSRRQKRENRYQWVCLRGFKMISPM